MRRQESGPAFSPPWSTVCSLKYVCDGCIRTCNGAFITWGTWRAVWKSSHEITQCSWHWNSFPLVCLSWRLEWFHSFPEDQSLLFHDLLWTGRHDSWRSLIQRSHSEHLICYTLLFDQVPFSLSGMHHCSIILFFYTVNSKLILQLNGYRVLYKEILYFCCGPIVSCWSSPFCPNVEFFC